MRFCDIACAVVIGLLPLSAFGAGGPNCQKLFVQASAGHPQSAYALAQDYLKPGGCGYNIRTSYRYLEIGAKIVSPVEGLRPIASKNEGVYLLAAWLRREKAVASYAIPSAAMDTMSVPEIAREIAKDRSAKGRARGIPRIPDVEITQAFNSMAGLLSLDAIPTDELRQAILSAVKALNDHDFPQATFELALYYHSSPDFNDQKKSRELLAKAAGYGHRSAGLVLAQALEEGEWGFDRDVPLACAIYRIFKAMGCPVGSPKKPSRQFNSLLAQLSAGLSSEKSYKGPPVPYDSTNPEAIWWVLEHDFSF